MNLTVLPRKTVARSAALAVAVCLAHVACGATAVTSENSALPSNPVAIDFSYAGYRAGSPIPGVKAVLLVKPSGSDDTALLQAAIDRVAAMPLRNEGFRGAVLLSPGRFHVQGQLHLSATGIVLRGSGSGPSGTVLVATGIDRRTLLLVGAQKDVLLDAPIAIDQDAPAGVSVILKFPGVTV